MFCRLLVLQQPEAFAYPCLKVAQHLGSGTHGFIFFLVVCRSNEEVLGVVSMRHAGTERLTLGVTAGRRLSPRCLLHLSSDIVAGAETGGSGPQYSASRLLLLLVVVMMVKRGAGGLLLLLLLGALLALYYRRLVLRGGATEGDVVQHGHGDPSLQRSLGDVVGGGRGWWGWRRGRRGGNWRGLGAVAGGAGSCGRWWW